ncbi:MAG: hypothetical protein CVT95_09625 [Bacteroidetes bacterium HGW-Bacteroidetes-12]|nr:MAG: hypothetical protein CVT95_09625 [Bacteroidetes bacterium HGW-Bacteroidetes-12]
MRFFKLSCKKATEMVEKEKINGLSFIDKLRLKLHLSVCKACRGYEKQSTLIDDFFLKTSASDIDNIKIEENPKLKETIINRLDNES